MQLDPTYVAAAAAIISAIISPVVILRTTAKTIASNKTSADHQAKLASSLKIADFRQTWINELRNALAELQARFINPLHNMRSVNELPTGSVDEMMLITAKIELLLNRKDDYYPGLVEAIRKFQDAPTNSQKEQRRQELVKRSQDALKVEWDRLKDEMRSIHA